MPPTNDAREEIEAAIGLHRTGDLDGAEAAYQSILDRAPNQPEATHFLGMLRHQRGETEEGLELIWSALQTAPGYVDAWVNFGNLLVVAEKSEAAENAYRQALELDPGHVGAWFNLGSVYRRRADFARSLEAYRHVVETVPDHPMGWRALSVCLREVGPLDEAIAAHRRVLELAPGDSMAMNRLGPLLYMAGRPDEAADVFRAWLEVEPDDPVARHGLAACGAEPAPVRATDAYVRHLFDSFADDFDEVLVEDLDYRAPQVLVDGLSEVLAAPPASLDVLDLGCGTGLCGELLRPFARRLEGVDLSAGMLRHAADRGCYDALHEEELTGHLLGRVGAFDVAASADTLCYFGALDEFLAAVHGALRPGGWLAFTVEALDEGDEPFRLAMSGRYTHDEGYLRGAIEGCGLVDVSIERASLRNEMGKPVAGLVVRARRR